MRIISRKKLREFTALHTKSQVSLNAWYRLARTGNYENLVELRNTFPSADQVGKYTVFNIGGNNYRLITVVIYEKKRIDIREILTHAEYDKNRWKKVK